MPRGKTDPSARYLAKVVEREPDACWPWVGAAHENGYGTFFDGAATVAAHRFGYTLRVGPIPPRHTVRHTCNNLACHNPRHWAAVKGGRLTEEGVLDILRRYAAGEHWSTITSDYGITDTYLYQIVHGRARSWTHVPRPSVTRRRERLTDDDVREIRRERAGGVTQAELSERFGVSGSTICRIASRQLRASVPDAPSRYASETEA